MAHGVLQLLSKYDIHCASAIFLNNSLKHWPISIIAGKLDINDYKFTCLTLILSLHYLAKCRSSSLTTKIIENLLHIYDI